jgi:hypothetical protein
LVMVVRCTKVCGIPKFSGSGQTLKFQSTKIFDKRLKN